MTLLEAETLAAAIAAEGIPARAFSPPDRPGYAVLVAGGPTYYDPPGDIQAVIRAALAVPVPLVTEEHEAADPATDIHPGGDTGGFGVSDPGGVVPPDSAQATLAAILRDRRRTGEE